MPIEIPEIDERDYRDILAEAMVRIPVHNPEWTNYNDSDPGVTIIQLFAFMTENLLYRANLMPERNRVTFLKLLGIPAQPAAAASGIVAFSKPQGHLQVETLTPNLEVLAGQVPFRTSEGLDVLPIEAHVYYKKKIIEGQLSRRGDELYQRLYQGFPLPPGTPSAYYETRQLEPPAPGTEFPAVQISDTADGALWIALLARPADVKSKTLETDLEKVRKVIAGKVLTLGILPSLTETGGRVLLAGPPARGETLELTFSIPIPQDFSVGEELHSASYRPLEARSSGNLLEEPGVVHLQLPDAALLELWKNLEPLEAGTGNFPPLLEDSAVSARLITWVRVSSPSLSARFSWLGINAARVKQGAHVASEMPGRGNGEPGQTFTLINRPVVPESLELTVNGEKWERIEDLMTADPEAPKRSPRLNPAQPQPQTRRDKAAVFTADRDSGEICFGDGLHGARPPENAIIRVNYDYGGGLRGNVGIDEIKKCPALANGIKVTNPIPAWGGDEAETTEEAEKNISQWLRHRDRLVSALDFKEITLRTPGIETGRVEVLPLFQPDLGAHGMTGIEGVVTVMVIPTYDTVHPRTPEPDRLFLDTVCNYLDPRRLVTTELYVRGPDYVPIWVSAGIEVVAGMDVPVVRENVKEALHTFLSPLTGGFGAGGWPLQNPVEKAELSAAVTRVDGVAKVNAVLLAIQPPEGGVFPVEQMAVLEGLQLPRIQGLAVQTGEPKTIEKLLEESGLSPTGEPLTQGATGGGELFPLPVILPECT
jgi:hypothetical protein